MNAREQLLARSSGRLWANRATALISGLTHRECVILLGIIDDEEAIAKDFFDERGLPRTATGWFRKRLKNAV